MERRKLSAEQLVKIYRGRQAVKGVSLEVEQGSIVGLLGPNGAGKTTTFYMIAGVVRPDRGTIYLDEAEITHYPMHKRARCGIGYLSQERSIFRKLTVEDNLMAILELLPISKAERKERLEMLLEELGIAHVRHLKGYALSGGRVVVRRLPGRWCWNLQSSCWTSPSRGLIQLPLQTSRRPSDSLHSAILGC